MKTANGVTFRIIAPARPSAESPLIFRRILKRSRMTLERLSRIWLRLPPVELWIADGRHEERQILLADPAHHVAQCGFDIGAVGDLVRHHAELGADRVRQLAPDHADRDRNRMAGAQRTHDDVDRVREAARRTPRGAACA